MTKSGSAKSAKLYKVTTGRGSNKSTLAVCTSQKEADATASTYQRNGCWDVAVTSQNVKD